MLGTNKDRKDNNYFIGLLISLVNFLTLIGYILMYPFECFFEYAKKFVLNFPSYISYLNDNLGSLTKIYHLLLSKAISIKNSLILFASTVSIGLQKRSDKRRAKRAKEKLKKSREKNKKLKEKQLAKKKKFKKKAKNRSLSKTKVTFIFLFGMFFSLFFIAAPVYGYFWYKQLPQPELLEQQTQNSSTKIFDRDGRLLYEIYIDKKYDPVSFNKIPDDVINATIAIEDANFYVHHGFDPIAIARAARATLLEDDLQGGSTITQQLVKNILLSPERTISRKIKELVIAIMVEQQYSKTEILSFYLNNIPYGGTSYGIQTASQQYFGKDVWELDLAEASLLAGLPSAPTAYSPVQGNEELAKQRQLQVLSRMVDLGYITSARADEAYKKELVFADQAQYIRAPHFVNYVRQELYKYYGQRAVDFGGLRVVTTIDLELQEKIEQIVREEIEKGARFDFTNAAVLVLSPRSGEILAYIGSVDYFDEEDGNFDIITAYRQPGSSIKPITYALGLEQGHTALTIINDTPITYQFDGQKYTPQNYDNKYHGKVTFRQALANSYNIPAVKLINNVGVDNMVQLGRNMGLNNWNVGDGSYGMSITLGGKETRLIDLTNVYATFARGGIYKNTTPFLSVTDNFGFDITHLVPTTSQRVLSEETSYIISHILSDNRARTPTFGSRSQLYIPDKTVSVKTGTTNDIRDNLTVGYTPSYTVGVWVGNNDNSPMNKNLASGITGAAPIWNRVMTLILEDVPNEPFVIPEGIVIKSDNACQNRTEIFDKAHEIPDYLCSRKKDSKEDKDD